MAMMKRLGLVLSVLVGITTLTATPASAAVGLTVSPATVHGSDFTWSCVVTADASAYDVSGASWLMADGSSFVETPRIQVPAGTTVTVTYTRNGAANTTYEYRCKAYASDSGTLTRGPKATVTTTGDTRFGAIVSNLHVTADNLPDYSRLYDQHRALFGAPMGIRIYSPGQLPNPADPNDQASWTQEMRWAAGKGEPITVSHKSADTARLTQLLNCAYTNNVHLTIIYFHEVQDDWGKNRNSAAEPSYYRQVFRDYRNVINNSQAGAAGLIKLEKNLMWYYQMFRAPTLGADWKEYVEANDPADQITWDVYAYPGLDDGVGRYLTADESFRFARDSSAYSGRPWGIGELGTVPQDGKTDGTGHYLPGVVAQFDPDGTKFIAWIRTLADAARNPASIGPSYAATSPALFVKWWCAYGGSGENFHLEQYPQAVTTYKALMQGMHF
jgi:hypothetical protein